MQQNTVSYVSQRLSDDKWISLPFWKKELDKFDEFLKEDLSNAPILLKNVPLAIFGTTLLNTKKYFPRSYKFLPIMASEKIQKAWTGSYGTLLLETSIAFVQQAIIFMAANNIKINSETKILDFGIGWGRIARLWLKYLSPSQVFGCDAWEKSIDLARECNIKNLLVKSDCLLKTLPFSESKFDLIYAFSIFTHLDENAFHCCLAGIFEMLKPGGGAILTIRPSIFWKIIRNDLLNNEELSNLGGFVFSHASDDPNFGDTTVDFPWIYDAVEKIGFKIEAIEWSPSDALQILVCLIKPKDS